MSVRTIKINSSGSRNNRIYEVNEEIDDSLIEPVPLENVPLENVPVVNRKRRTNKRTASISEVTASPVINITKDNSTIPVLTTTKQAGGTSGSNMGSKTNIPPGPRLNMGQVQAQAQAQVQSQPPIIDVKDQTGGLVQTKVVLKRKNRTSKVILKTKTTSSEVPTAKIQGSGSPNLKKTRRLIVKQVSKRFKKTRHVVKHAKEMPIDALRKILIMKKLIKPHSKAPESILRQIYADSVIVGKKTL